MYNFATLFDINYLNRGLCLEASLKEHLKNDFKLYVLCLDTATFQYLKTNVTENIIPIELKDIEEQYPELLVAKANRSRVEYYFTLSPVWPLYILEKHPECSRITTLDADLYFFSSPSIIFDTYHKDDILITPHDFSSDLINAKKYGIFNVSFQSFPNNYNGKKILNIWKNKCVAWCGDFLDEKTGYFADQKYLDEWIINFEHVQAITLKTAGRAPWNIKESPISFKNKKLFINNKPLIYYHFHHFRMKNRFIIHGLHHYNIKKLNRGTMLIYNQYVKSINKFNKQINTNNDKNISRYQQETSTNIFKTVWVIEIGAILIGNNIYHFNISYLKKILSAIKRKLINGKHN